MTRALLATDGSESACDALRRGSQLLGSAADLTVVCIAQIPTPLTAAGRLGVGSSPGAEVVADARRRAVNAVATTVDALDTSAKALVRLGSPGRTLCELASEGDYDVLVVGSHGAGFLERVLIGSVSKYVIDHAPCPVLVVRDPVLG